MDGTPESLRGGGGGGGVIQRNRSRKKARARNCAELRSSCRGDAHAAVAPGMRRTAERSPEPWAAMTWRLYFWLASCRWGHRAMPCRLHACLSVCVAAHDRQTSSGASAQDVQACVAEGHNWPVGRWPRRPCLQARSTAQVIARRGVSSRHVHAQTQMASRRATEQKATKEPHRRTYAKLGGRLAQPPPELGLVEHMNRALIASSGQLSDAGPHPESASISQPRVQVGSLFSASSQG